MPQMILKTLLWLLISCSCYARIYTDEEAHAAWETMKRQPINEKNFHAACDLMQDIAQTNINISYALLAEYLPMVRQTGHREWVHVILMNWARAKESLGFFPEAEVLYRQARNNTEYGTRAYNEAMVGTTLLFSEWGRSDSLEKYAAMGIASCLASGDNENRSFLCTFRGVSRSTDTAFMRLSLDTAIALATPLPDKNALFTALYNRATIYSQYNPQVQATILSSLLQLSGDSGLRYKPRLYQRTTFYFRNPRPSVYYQLIQVNMLLTDYDNASRFAGLFYDAAIKPRPSGTQAPDFYAELALVMASQGRFDSATVLLDRSRALFKLPDDKVPKNAFLLASGMLAEHEKQFGKALHYFALAVQKGTTYGRHFMQPAIYYAHALTLAGHLPEAGRALAEQRPVVQARLYSALGFYYYRYYADLLKARGDYAYYGAVLDTFYRIKDSLFNLNHYRAIQDMNARIQLQDKEQQLALANKANAAEIKNRRTERRYLIVLLGLSAITVTLLWAYARNQRFRKKQAEQITAQQLSLQQRQLEEMKQRHQLDRLESAMRAEENERSRIAGELHDEAGSLLSVARLNISSALEKDLSGSVARDKLEKTNELITSVAAGIRHLSHRLMPPAIEKYGFHKAVQDITDTINLPGKLKLDTIIIGFDDTRKYPIVFLNTLYRVMMELLNNVLRHAQASSALLELVEHEDAVSIMVEDNGIGIPAPAAAKGKGLEAIRSKIDYLNGSMEVIKKEEGGTLIVIDIPI